eukprot:TRINITY_DN3984_c0_g9_i1.p1 TRINITY_DN3984_c0_g9~~TRINITY_DN3984_c0_g9_i1.p1  ORF type:complete len:491 (+),score=185.40 TRINITY_DN3984_c0_g9_i1:41-1474(+)
MAGKYMYDLIVVGGGSGGVRASRWAASQASKPKVALVEMPYSAVKGGLGGTCVLRGCVPKKLLWYGGHYGHDFEDAKGYGWQVDPAGHDWGMLMEKKRAEMKRLNGVYGNILKNNDVEFIEGHASLVDRHTVKVGEKEYTATTILLATGARPHLLDIPGKEHSITSDDILDIPTRPNKLVVLGAGYIACEMACIFKGYSTEAHLVYRADHPLRGFDDECRAFISEQMSHHGINMHPLSVPKEIRKQDDGRFTVVYVCKGEEVMIKDADQVLMATGRKANVEGLGLENAGVELNAKGAVKVDEYSRTSAENIYAVGDITDRMQLTPVALHEGMCFANTVYGGKDEKPCHEIVPSAVFTTPPMGVCGLTEKQATDKYKDIDVYTSGFRTMVHTLSGSKERSFMKMIVDPNTDKVLGIHIVGKDAAEIIQGFGAAMKCGATKSQIDSTIGVHPSSAEELVTMRTATRKIRGGEEVKEAKI